VPHIDDPDFWKFDAWPAITPAWYEGATLHPEWDDREFHVDLGCGRLKKGRIGIDRFPDDGVNIVMDLDTHEVKALPTRVGNDADWTSVRGRVGLPFPDSSIESLISHHCFEHIGDGFIGLVDEIYRVLKPGGIFRAITPLFPSRSAVEDPDHRRYFMTGTWDVFCGTPGDTPQNCWLSSFSTPYTRSRFTLVDKDFSPPVPIEQQWGETDSREIRVTLRAEK
jgi:SAM-dependent methyltransferase